jgi:hypothetical protein
VYITTSAGNWNLKGIGYQVDFTHVLATPPATRRTFKFGEPSGAYPNPTTHSITDDDVTITINAVGNSAVFSTNAEGVGVDSVGDEGAGNTAAQRRVDGTLTPTPEAIHFSFDRKVSLESLTVSSSQFINEDVVISWVSGDNPFDDGLQGYSGNYTLTSNSLTISATDVAARSPYPLTIGMGGQDPLVIEAGTVLAFTSALNSPAVTDGGIILDMITAHVVEDDAPDADFDDDDDVDGNDFLIWQRGQGVGTTNAQGDADDDDDVDGDDLAAWEAAFGSSTVNAGAVPEPASMALAALGAVAAVSFGARRSTRIRRR